MAKEAKKLTKSTLDRLRRQAQENLGFSAYVADAGQPGLYAWARRGKVRFVFAYRPPTGGRRKRIKIDDYGAITLDQARESARNLRGRVANRKDPQVEREKEQQLAAEEKKNAVTVAEAVESYLEDLERRAESPAEKRGKRSGYASAKNRLNRHVVARLGSKRLQDVMADHLFQMRREMKSTPVEFNRTLTALSAVYGYAARAPQRWVQVGFNPAQDVEKYAETGKRRALNSEELTALGRVMIEADETGSVPMMEEGKPVMREDRPVRLAVNPSALLAIRLLALTGFRRAEVVGHTMKDRRGKREGLRWGDVDLDSGLIHLHDTKTGPQERVIGAAALELLRATKPERAADDDPVCPGAIPGQSYIGIDKDRRKLWHAAGLDGVDLHSLRHSFASIGAHVQSGRFVGHVSALLGHGYQSRSITERYISEDPERLRPAADAIAGAIATALGLTEPARVLAFEA